VRVTLGLPTDHVTAVDEFVTGPAVMELAREVEAAGFDACNVTDHPFPEDRWLRVGGHHAQDPFVALSFAAAATTTIRLQTNILVLGYRSPFLAAKAITTLDALSGGRVTVGVASGYLRSEFRALGASFDDRNETADETIDAMKAAWTGESVTLTGTGWAVEGHTMLPRPTSRPHPPIWIGGNAKQAIRRVVARAQGWMPFPNPAAAAKLTKSPVVETVADLAARVGYLREQAEAAGRTEPIDICMVPFGWAFVTPDSVLDLPALVDQAHELAALGVTWLSVNLPAETRKGFLHRAERFAAEVLPNLPGRQPPT
jgi:probable F420-dependent oxidoreductase